jgi:hypothetical protein
MSLYYRQINLALWQENIGKNSCDFSADSITNDLITKKNTLSLFKLESAKNAVLAFVGLRPRLESLCLLAMRDEDLIDFHIEHTPKNGTSLYLEANKNHYEISELTHETLGKLGHVVLSCISNDAFTIFEKEETITLFEKAWGDNLLNKKAAKKEFLEKYTPELTKES